MIISGVDRYIASWFKILHITQKAVNACYSEFEACYDITCSMNYYVYSVSVSNGVVMVVFVTDSQTYLKNYIRAKFYGAYNEPTVCIPTHRIVNLGVQLSALQLITVFHV